MPSIIADRFTHEERLEIYKWTGEGYTLREICKMVNNKSANARRVRIPTIERILAMPEAHKFVAKFRMEFLKNIKDIPISEKKVRLDDLERLRQRLMYLINNIHLERSPKEISKFLTVTKRALEVLDLARNEMEQRPGVSIGIGLNQGDLSDLTDEQLQEQRDDLLRRAAKLVEQGTSASGEITEGNEATPAEGSPPVLLAPSKELQRDQLPRSDTDVSHVRQQDGND